MSNPVIADNKPAKVNLTKGEEYYFCACGRSANQPFCDGSHKSTGFDDTNPDIPVQEVKSWQGKTIRTHFNPNVCMHAGHCRGLGQLRKLETELGDLQVAEKIAHIVANCPSGALSYEMVDNSQPVVMASSAEVEVIQGGEIRIRSAVDSTDLKLHERQPENRLALCRCGMSKNKPFCDASHSERKDFR